jgi:hypothetical protein
MPICPSCGGNTFHGNSCIYNKPVTNSSSYNHSKYVKLFEKLNDREWEKSKEFAKEYDLKKYSENTNWKLIFNSTKK